jgi:hypothetical protein
MCIYGLRMREQTGLHADMVCTALCLTVLVRNVLGLSNVKAHIKGLNCMFQNEVETK